MASSSSSSSIHRWKHDLFLNFRGTDTRTNFTSHLYHALSNRGIKTFIDDQLERGEEISPALFETIECSKISILVFSQDYASSSYCLDELVHILACKQSKQQKVIPIFYKVDPEDVRQQTGRFGEAFSRLWEVNLEKVQTWRVALANAAEFCGWHIDDG